MSKQIQLTEETKQLFVELALDACNWGGTPLWDGNVGGGAVANGHLTDLKKKGLVKTWEDGGDVWVEFTEEGKEYAKELNIDLD